MPTWPCRSVKTDTKARGARGPICDIDHQYMYATLMIPIRVKQLPVALPSFVGWLGRWSLVVANRTSCPPNPHLPVCMQLNQYCGRNHKWCRYMIYTLQCCWLIAKLLNSSQVCFFMLQCMHEDEWYYTIQYWLYYAREGCRWLVNQLSREWHWNLSMCGT